MTKVTCWYRQKPNKDYSYNHYEEGWCSLKHPTITSDEQNVWLTCKWLKRHTYIKDHKILE